MLDQTAVNKYYIGIGQNFKSYKNSYAFGGTQNIPLNYPLVQIDNHGLVAVKCPTITGGKWMENVEFPLCSNKDLVVKGQQLNVILT